MEWDLSLLLRFRITIRGKSEAATVREELDDATGLLEGAYTNRRFVRHVLHSIHQREGELCAGAVVRADEVSPTTRELLAEMVMSRPRTERVYQEPPQEDWELSQLTLIQALMTIPLVLGLFTVVSGLA